MDCRSRPTFFHALGEEKSIEIVDIIFGIPSIIAMLLIYLGVRGLAQLIGLKHWVMSWPYIPAGAAVIALAAVLLPHPTGTSFASTTSSTGLATLHSMRLFEVFLCGLVIVQVKALSQHVGSMFIQALKWLAVFVAADILILLQLAIYELFWVPNSIFYMGILVALIVMPFALIRAGYVFNRIYAYPARDISSLKPTMIDIIVYAALFVTRPRDIDPLLDGLRQITAVKAGEALTPQDKEQLRKAYLAIEQYIISQEPVLNLTRPTFRQRIQFHLGLEEREFLNELGQ